ncbi:MAG: LPXTG cell wall anchor domain-containing protein [Nanoarchaeota archaeon]|nr:LPXTG cell wall anchor domain-containing protein [Nanoarchaeota archaeon]
MKKGLTGESMTSILVWIIFFALAVAAVVFLLLRRLAS